jgi:4-hydroxy-tetrahydrodipicolinate reductase
MKIAIIGHGVMGHLVAQTATRRGHEVVVAPSFRSRESKAGALADVIRGCDVAIDFTVADAVMGNATECANAGVALVEGTTGWNASKSQVLDVMKSANVGMVYGANFSIGVNLFFKAIRYCSELFGAAEQYSPYLWEAHHQRKLDAPSGTALVIKNIMESSGLADVPVTSTRAGYIPGTHSVVFDSEADSISLTHTARSRTGFADGAVLAAEWIAERDGVYEFSEVIDEIYVRRSSTQ